MPGAAYHPFRRIGDLVVRRRLLPMIKAAVAMVIPGT